MPDDIEEWQAEYTASHEMQRDAMGDDDFVAELRDRIDGLEPPEADETMTGAEFLAAVEDSSG